MSIKNYHPEVQPQDILLGKRRQWKRLPNKKSRIVQYPERFYYVSLLASIELQLNNQRILDMIADPHINRPGSGLLTDFTDGSLINEHELFSVDPHSLKISLYYDDLEITNEKTRRKHKLAMFYYQLANIYLAYRSKLKTIHLIAIVETKCLKKYGVDMILKPFIHELNVLGEDYGYNFRINGGNICLRGPLLAAVADTPASQFLGAFKESVGGTKRKCRHCMADFESMQTLFMEEDFDLGSKEMHEYHLEQLHNIQNCTTIAPRSMVWLREVSSWMLHILM